jgi:hypothetical protein
MLAASERLWHNVPSILSHLLLCSTVCMHWAAYVIAVLSSKRREHAWSFLQVHVTFDRQRSTTQQRLQVADHCDNHLHTTFRYKHVCHFALVHDTPVSSVAVATNTLAVAESAAAASASCCIVHVTAAHSYVLLLLLLQVLLLRCCYNHYYVLLLPRSWRLLLLLLLSLLCCCSVQ